MKHNWQTIKLNEILTFRDGTPDALKVSSGDIPIISKISFAEGKIELRNDGISNTKLVKILPNDLVISGINAEKGAISINSFGKEISATIHYSAYFNDVEKVNLGFLHYYLRSAVFQNDLKFQLANGIKTELKPKRFLNLEISLPPLKVQQKILSTLEKVKVKIDEVNTLKTEQVKDINNLLFSKYTDLIKSAQWLPMKEVAPIIRRPVILNDEALYPELGIRCFGKGTFHKPALTGTEVATKKIFQIKKGDLVFSNVFAWEGGIAVAKEEDNDRYGSHRFISCVADEEKALAEFLCYHFLSPKGLEDINACSPGGAGRNKTLGLDKLMKILVPVPSIELQKEFVELLEKTNAIKEHHKQTEQELTELMPSLLDKAFKGEL